MDSWFNSKASRTRPSASSSYAYPPLVVFDDSLKKSGRNEWGHRIETNYTLADTIKWLWITFSRYIYEYFRSELFPRCNLGIELLYRYIIPNLDVSPPSPVVLKSDVSLVGEATVLEETEVLLSQCFQQSRHSKFTLRSLQHTVRSPNSNTFLAKRSLLMIISNVGIQCS
jgi:hypothetical protein